MHFDVFVHHACRGGFAWYRECHILMLRGFMMSATGKSNDGKQRDRQCLYALLVDGFHQFCEAFVEVGGCVTLNTMIVMDVVESFLKDMERISTFHEGITDCSLERRYGYLTYWITKLRPVQIAEALPPDGISEEGYKSLSQANAYYAFWLIFPALCRPLADSSRTAEWCKEYIHTLHARPVSGDQLMLMFETIAKTSRFPADFPCRSNDGCETCKQEYKNTTVV
jgi:hypothetical protein